ncbi:substrate-binding domain-containing protein [Corynebacterium sp. 3HC-13]|nr:substrate-binding domain-containing protein [Corynebacterium poyangense]
MKKLTQALATTLVAGCTGAMIAGCGVEPYSHDEITLALSTQTNPFFVQVRDGARAKAEELGVTINVQDAGDDALKQADQLNNAIATAPGAVLVNPVDSDAVGNSVVALNKANIPVFALDRTANAGKLTSYVASDNISGGKQAADAMAQAIGGKGKILILQGTPGTSASRDRGQGFREQLAYYPGITIAAEQTAGFDRTKGLDVATNLLQSNPDVVGIFAENDEMALGAIEAAGGRAGKDIAIIGFDGTAEGLTAVHAGSMTATIAQQPRELGTTAVAQAQLLLSGQEVPGVVPVPVVTVDQRNIAEFYQEERHN